MKTQTVIWTPISEYDFESVSHKPTLCCVHNEWFRAIYSPQNKSWRSEFGNIKINPTHFCRVSFPSEVYKNSDHVLTAQIVDDSHFKLSVGHMYLVFRFCELGHISTRQPLNL